ncbi:hypothetical protein [Acinetobacter sp.]|uniref:hypothetical protein n=1 Tax=Acinetobacter sp. TaxID=472 RepID=UPI0031DBF56A
MPPKAIGTIDSNVLEILRLLQQETAAQTRRFEVSRLQRAMNEARHAKNFEDLMNQAVQNLHSGSQSQTNALKKRNQTLKEHDIGLETKPSINSEPVQKQNQDQKKDYRGRAIAGQSQQIDEKPTPNKKSKGRFVAGEVTTVAKFSDVVGRFGNTVSGFGADTRGIDPTVDALHELSTALSPVKRVASLAFRPLTGLAKMRKRSEPLPREQSEHNKKEIKLLNQIADHAGQNGGSGIGKLLGRTPLGRLLGGLGRGRGKGKGGRVGGKLGRFKKLGKFLKFGRGVPLLGAALAALSFSDWKGQSTAEKGGTVGSLVGGGVGAFVGSIVGPVGTVVGGMVGSWIGDKLGSTVAPYFKSWVESLEKSDIAKNILDKWDSFVSIVTKWFGEAWERVKNKASDAWDKTKKKGKQVIDTVENGVKSAVNYISGGASPLLDLIAKGEVGTTGMEGYDKMFRGSRITAESMYGKPLSQLTIGEVKKLQEASLKEQKSRGISAKKRSSAAGRYQFIRTGFDDYIRAAGLTDNDVFSAENQNKMADAMMRKGKYGLDAVKAGKATVKQFQNNVLSPRWASLKNSSGRGNYDNDGINHAGISSSAIQNAISEEITKKPATKARQAKIAVKPARDAMSTTNAQAINIPKAESPKIETAIARVSSKGPEGVVVVNSATKDIMQDVSNPYFAMVFSGGIGQA